MLDDHHEEPLNSRSAVECFIFRAFLMMLTGVILENLPLIPRVHLSWTLMSIDFANPIHLFASTALFNSSRPGLDGPKAHESVWPSCDGKRKATTPDHNIHKYPVLVHDLLSVPEGSSWDLNDTLGDGIGSRGLSMQPLLHYPSLSQALD